jgi:outer membrane receptor protein involved in Fe transport
VRSIELSVVSRQSSVIVWCLAAVALATPLAGQADTTKRDTLVLAPIEVMASIAPVAGPQIGSGIPARIIRVPGREIDAWEPRTVAQALGRRAGISLYDDLGSPAKLNLVTRGFAAGPVVGLPAGVSVFLDGVRQNEADAAQVNFDLLPLEHVKRIELLLGAGSLLGPNSLGGAINLLTRRGTAPREAELELSGGSFDTYSAEASLGGLAGAWDYYAAGGYERSRGWREATGTESYNGFVNLGRLAATRGVSLQLLGSSSYAETAGSLPESVFDTDPRINFTAGDFEDLRLLQVAVSGYAAVGRGRGSATAYLRRHDAERFNVNQAPDPDVRSRTRATTVGATLDWRRAVMLGSRPASLRLGLDAAANAVNVRLFEGDTLTTDVDSPSWDVAGYALADVALGRVTVSGGLRYDYVRVPFEDKLDPASDTTSSFSRVSPRVGASLALGPGRSLYASLGKSFRAPAVLELACADPAAACPLPFALGDDPPLEPVVATTYELGARWAAAPVLLDAALYRTDVQDDIAFLQSDAAIFEGYFANIGDTRREGLELEASVAFASGHSLYLNYAWTRATYRTAADIFSVRADSLLATSPLAGPNQVEPGDRLPLVPEHQVRAGGTLRLAERFEAGLDARYTGRQWLRGDEANETRPLDGYLTIHLRLEWETGPWGASAVVTNLFDSVRPVFGTFNENRPTGELERFLTPLEGRALRFVVRRRFGS